MNKLIKRYVTPGDPLAFSGVQTVRKYSDGNVKSSDIPGTLAEVDGYVR